ncbi:putative Regulation of nuclear pre-mRNA domain-containing protein 1B [Hypsibius exemplaris]|uniref:Regulation of nuclear pre-mRNA domain-containing protein 1B n=1 Tax=Hypsibius exemplaris TaxID=2072580 RepID=A0A1W0WZS7_HYPEX|nr:putative Regulation of nuclear pre-mRNA domain-containing protein 1B [Hypsibius exemplaris]
MSAFSEQAFKAKLKDLNNTQASIQTISLWAGHHRKQYARIVAIWMEELREAREAGRKLTLLYFANDVVQNMRKKALEFLAEFQTVLLEAFINASKQARVEGEEKVVKSLGRLAQVWRDRTIFEEAFILKLEQILVEQPAAIISTPKPAAMGKPAAYTATVPVTMAISHTPPPPEPQPDSKRIKIDVADFQAYTKANQDKQVGKGKLEPTSDDEDYEEIAPYVNGTNSSESPKLETLLRLVQKLQSAPSANGTIRSKIAELPGVITDPAAIDRISDPTEIERLVKVAREGLQVVMEYNKELNQELLDRQAVAAELARQLAFHRKIIDEKEHLREELAQQISERRAFRDKLAIHTDSLPDLNRAGGLTNSFSDGQGRATAASNKVTSLKHSLFK